MDTIPANLRMLAGQFEDARRFHEEASRHSSGEHREQHLGRALAYAAMISEITRWKLRRLDRFPPGPGHDDATDRCCMDGHAALLERVYRIHGGGGTAPPDPGGHACNGDPPKPLSRRHRLQAPVNACAGGRRLAAQAPRIFRSPKRSRPCGAEKSSTGPIEMIPCGLMVGWLRK